MENLPIHFLIGSRLLVRLFPTNQKIRARLKPDTDFDVLLETEPSNDLKVKFKEAYGPKTEFHVIPLVWKYFTETTESLKNVLFTLKASHVCFDKVHAKKTFYDIFLMSEEGCTIIEPLFYELHSFWGNKFGQKWRADFTKESMDFFDDAVSREHVHDELHELVKKYNKPAFKFLQEEGQTTVWVCPEKWKTVSEDIRRQNIIEEARVLAIERDLTNPLGLTNQHQAFYKWVEAMVLRIAPIWQVPYICNNFSNFMKIREDYYSDFLNKQTISKHEQTNLFAN